MDSATFDRLARLLGGAVTRRHALRAFVATVLAGSTVEEILAGGKKHRGKSAAKRRKGSTAAVGAERKIGSKGKSKGKGKKKKKGTTAVGAGLQSCADTPLEPGQDFLDCDFANDDLRAADLHSSSFSNVDLTDADLCGADLHITSFTDCTLDGANLTDVDLDGSTHNKSSYVGANFEGVTLRQATINKCNFRDVNFTRANLLGATLDDVDFSGAFFCQTIRPDGSTDDRDCDNCENTCGCHTCDQEDCLPPDCCADPESGDGVCVDTQNGDLLNCGGCNDDCDLEVADNCIDGECACGNDPVCTGGEICVEGTCSSPCDNNQVFCVTEGSGECVTGVCCEEGEGPGCPEGQTCIAGGCIGAGQFRVVLAWDENPRDLDTHLWLPPASPFHVAYYAKGTQTQHPYAELDIDDTSSFGPETLTIAQLQEGTYLYAVHLFAGSGTIGTSDAVVKVYEGANLIKTYPVPTGLSWDVDNGGNVWWNVFTLTYDGTTSAITDVNTASGEPAPYPDTTLRGAGRGMPAKSSNGGQEGQSNRNQRKPKGKGKSKNRGRARR